MSHRAVFHYKALSRDGKIIDGQVEADTWDEAHIYVTGLGYIVIDLGGEQIDQDDDAQADHADQADSPPPPKTNEFMDDLAQAGRRKGYARMLLPESGTATAEQRAEAIGFVRDWMKRRKLTIKTISKRLGSGFANATISQVLSDSYVGDTDSKLRSIIQLIEQDNESQRVVRPEGLIETAGVKSMMTCIKQTAKRTRCMGAIIAPAGCSKTTVLEAAHSMIPGSVLVRVDSSSNRPVALARQILHAANDRTSGYRFTQLMERLRDVFSDAGRLILVDEAHRLKGDGFELLRDLVDMGSAVVVVGTSDMNIRINDTAAGAQIYSRCHMIVDIASDMLSPAGKRKPRAHITTEEVLRICDGDALRFTDDAKDLLFQIANAPGLGCIRTCELLVSIVAEAHKNRSVPIDAKMLLRAMRDVKSAIHFRFAEQEIDRRSEQLKRRVG